jgi:hypothetical protein
MTFKDFRNFVQQHKIVIPSECWRNFQEFVNSQLVAIASLCIDPRMVNIEKTKQVIECLEKHIPYAKIVSMVHSLNPELKHRFFETDFIQMYLVLAYISLAYQDQKKVDMVMLSYAIYSLIQTFRKFFTRGCDPELLQAAYQQLHNKSLYKIYHMNHL